MRSSQADAQLPTEVQEVGVTVRKSTSSPLALFTLYSPNGTLRPALHQQLRLHQHQRPDDARPRHRPGADLRRRPVRDARLGASGSRSPSSRSRSTTSSAPSRRRAPANAAGQIGVEPGAARTGSSPTPCGRRAGSRRRKTSATSSCGRVPTAPWSASRTWRASSWARRTTTSRGGSTASRRP